MPSHKKFQASRLLFSDTFKSNFSVSDRMTGPKCISTTVKDEETALSWNVSNQLVIRLCRGSFSVPLFAGGLYSIKGEKWMLIISGSKKPMYSFAKEGQKSNLNRKTFTVNWRCRCTKLILSMRSWIKVAEYLLNLRVLSLCRTVPHGPQLVFHPIMATWQMISQAFLDHEAQQLIGI